MRLHCTVVAAILALSVYVVDDVGGVLVDLSHLYDEDILYHPYYFPFDFQIMQRGYVSNGDGSLSWLEYNKFSMAEHMGTHMDAPAHYSNGPGRWRLDQIPIDRFLGDAVVIDISDRSDVDTNPDNILLVSDILQWEAQYGQIPDGSIVLVYTGWDQYWGDKLKYMGSLGNDTSEYHWPGIGQASAEWLVNNRQISGIGTDTMSIDSGGNHVAHNTILSENIYGLENLNNLGQLPPAGARAYVFPMNIRDGSGAPCRVIAEYGTRNQFNVPPPAQQTDKESTIITTSLLAFILIIYTY